MLELKSYAEQYRHFEKYLPGFLAEVVSLLPDGPGRALVQENLDDELGDPIPHVELFEQFAGAVGAEAQPPSPATTHLLATYDALLFEGPESALAGFLRVRIAGCRGCGEQSGGSAKALRVGFESRRVLGSPRSGRYRAP